MKKYSFVLWVYVLSDIITLEEIKQIKETKKKRKELSNIFNVIHSKMLTRITTSNMFLFHSEYSQLFLYELSNTLSKSEIESSIDKRFYEVSLWKMVRDGFCCYMDVSQEMFVTIEKPDLTLTERMRLHLSHAPLSIGTLFDKLEIPIVWYPRYKNIIKYMKHYKRIRIEEDLIFITKFTINKSEKNDEAKEQLST